MRNLVLVLAPEVYLPLRLVGANFHFVGDVIAGGYLGCFMGWLVVTVWERGVHTLRPVAEVSGRPDSKRTRDVVDTPVAAE